MLNKLKQSQIVIKKQLNIQNANYKKSEISERKVNFIFKFRKIDFTENF